MPCYAPLAGWWSRTLSKNGKRQVVFSASEGFPDRPCQVPCGQCVGCRLERSRQWAVRLTHEAQFHLHRWFWTLTYDDEHLPANGSLRPRDWVLFMKRLREARSDTRVRYFQCGEYGETTWRPHHHAIVFGVDWADRERYSQNARGDVLYRSQELDDLWSHGQVWIGGFSFASAAYVARYVMKKVTGDAAADHYRRVDPETGEVYSLVPPYVTMSRRPGIGTRFMERYSSDLFPADAVVVNGVESLPPRFYVKQLEKSDPVAVKKLKRQRIMNAGKHRADNTSERLRVRQEVKEAQISTLTRKL